MGVLLGDTCLVGECECEGGVPGRDPSGLGESRALIGLQGAT